MSEWADFVSNVGFPIAVCFYLLFTYNKTIKKNTEAIQSLNEWLRGKFK